MVGEEVGRSEDEGKRGKMRAIATKIIEKREIKYPGRLS
jgi:hypothetical protein